MQTCQTEAVTEQNSPQTFEQLLDSVACTRLGSEFRLIQDSQDCLLITASPSSMRRKQLYENNRLSVYVILYVFYFLFFFCLFYYFFGFVRLFVLHITPYYCPIICFLSNALGYVLLITPYYLICI